MLTLKDFNDYVAQLEDHDWFFDHCADYTVYTTGRAQEKALTDKAMAHRELAGAYTAYRKYHFAPRMNRAEDNARRAERDQRITVLRDRLSTTEGVQA